MHIPDYQCWQRSLGPNCAPLSCASCNQSLLLVSVVRLRALYYVQAPAKQELIKHKRACQKEGRHDVVMHDQTSCSHALTKATMLTCLWITFDNLITVCTLACSGMHKASHVSAGTHLVSSCLIYKLYKDRTLEILAAEVASQTDTVYLQVSFNVKSCCILMHWLLGLHQVY